MLAALRSLTDEGLRELDQGLGIDLGDGATSAESVADIGRRAAGRWSSSVKQSST
jgi:hypothetical protein